VNENYVELVILIGVFSEQYLKEILVKGKGNKQWKIEAGTRQSINC